MNKNEKQNSLRRNSSEISHRVAGWVVKKLIKVATNSKNFLKNSNKIERQIKKWKHILDQWNYILD